MCDTVVALGNSTEDGSVIFGKNSNRVPNEAHNVVFIKGQKHKINSKVKCTYITIPQVEETYTVLLLKPFWMFGCEMGANEYGVTIGNEAVWSKEPIRDIGLLGMDMMRLALERSKNAKEALESIIDLLEKYGQGGQCSYKIKGRDYHNSFIIADPTEAWVLETADRFWIAEKVKDVRTISNSLSIGSEYDLIHSELINHAVKKGYSKSQKEFNFAKDFIPDFRFYHVFKESKERSQYFAKGRERQQCTTTLMLEQKGKINLQDVIAVLRSHNIKNENKKEWAAFKAKAQSPCHHAIGKTVPDQTTGSMVSQLKKNIQVHWVTGSSIPCISTFKPIFFPKPGLSRKLKLSSSTYNPTSYWWINEKFQRLVSKDYQRRLGLYIEERDQLEKEFKEDVEEILKKVKKKPMESEVDQMERVTRKAFKISDKKVREWINRIEKLPKQIKSPLPYRLFWKKQNKEAKLK